MIYIHAIFDMLRLAYGTYLVALSIAALHGGRATPGPFALLGMLWRGEVRGR